MIDIFKETTLSDSSLDYYTYTAIQSLNLVAPPYSPKMLAEVKNTYHEQAHLFKSRVIKGFRFVDEDNAKNIRKFLETSLYDQFDNKISFQKYLEMQLFNYSIHYRFYDQIGFFSGKAQKLYPTSPKYIYPNRDKTAYWQIKPSADLKDMLNDIGSKESQINYKEYHTEFKAVSDEAPTKGNELFEFCGKTSRSDYFPNIPYLEALGSIETNKYIGSYNQKWLSNGTNWKSVVNLYGLDEDDQQMKKIIDDFSRKLNDPSESGKVIVKGIPNEESKVTFEKPEQNTKEDFSAERDANRDEILAANGVNPTVLGIKTNESSLTSTSQKEAIQLYVETQAINDIVLEQEHYNMLFKIIDPSYDTQLILEPISFENATEQAEIKTLEIDNEIKLINAGSLRRYNEFRADNKREPIEEAEWNTLRKSYTDSGMSFS